MKVPLSWLREYLETLPDTEELAVRLTMAGLEVEDVRLPDPELVNGLVVARIEDVARHPNADRLSLCRVDDGSGAQQIVCGASNMGAGDAVVLARPGTRLPGGTKIKKAKIRGHESNGMLCSAAELGIADDHEGILILESGTAGDDAASLLGLNEVVLEIGITPNRGDCLSVRGLAREINAVCGVGLLARFDERCPEPSGRPRVTVQIDSPAQCTLYRGVEVKGVSIGPSPAWVAGKLSAAGLRPINNVVDVTNLVLIELGQPLHAFDADLLAGPSIAVRVLDEEQDVETLDGQPRRLLPGDLAIWDDAGPVAVAGVMGGARTAVHADTKNLFLESASFARSTVRRTSRRLGLVSESSYRFERGVDPDMVEEALLRAAGLIAELAGGEIGQGMSRAGESPAPAAPISLRPSRVTRVLGAEVSSGEIQSCLEAVGIRVDVDGERLAVRAPSHRYDLEREVDLIEEVARIRGYDAIDERVPVRSIQEAEVPASVALHRRLRLQLSGAGLSEAVALAFCSRRHNELFAGLHTPRAAVVEVANPLRSDAGDMRRSLLPALAEAQQGNARNGLERVDLFAIGRTFSSDGEIDAVGGLMWGPRRARGPGAAGPVTFWDTKGVVEKVAAALGAGAQLSWKPDRERKELHPSAAASVWLGGSELGYLGMIHPDVAEELEIPHDIAVFEVDTRKLLEYAPARSSLRQIPRHPASSRDISLLVPDGVLAGDVITAVEELGEQLIERIFVFDEYTGKGIGPGQRALAFSIVYRALDRTLTDEEVGTLHDSVVDHLVKGLGVRVRA